MSKTIKRSGTFSVYIVRCKNGTYYTGYSNDLNRRIAQHNGGKGAKYLKGKAPVTLVYQKVYRYYKCALRAERWIKSLTRWQKEQLVRAYARVVLTKGRTKNETMV